MDLSMEAIPLKIVTFYLWKMTSQTHGATILVCQFLAHVSGTQSIFQYQLAKIFC